MIASYCFLLQPLDVGVNYYVAHIASLFSLKLVLKLWVQSTKTSKQSLKGILQKTFIRAFLQRLLRDPPHGRGWEV